jgi:hypothetical protein
MAVSIVAAGRRLLVHGLSFVSTDGRAGEHPRPERANTGELNGRVWFAGGTAPGPEGPRNECSARAEPSRVCVLGSR